MAHRNCSRYDGRALVTKGNLPSVSPKTRMSVLLPVYNGAAYLRECITSVLGQTLDSFELIIADDRSTDTSKEIIASFQDSRIRVFYKEKNSGLFDTLNFLMAQASAPIVRFLCQDDFLYPDCIRTEVDFFTKHPEIAMAYCRVREVDHEGRVLSCEVFDEPEVLTSEQSLQMFYYHGCLPGNLSPVSARREAILLAGGFNASLVVAGDYEMWIRICQKHDLGIIPERLLALRRHSQQLSRARSSSVSGFGEKRMIRSTLLPLLPSPIQGWARTYARLRFDVLDAHHVLWCLFKGRPRDSWRVLRTMGLRNFVLGVLGWIATGKNRLWKPRPRLHGLSIGPQKHLAR